MRGVAAVTVRRVGDPVLRTVAQRVADVPEAVKQVGGPLLATLLDFRAKNGFGRAIAAPQIGSSVRMIAAVLDGRSERLLVNPVITWRSKAMLSLWDDCFSFPELMVPVRRHESISVAFVDEKGEEKQWNDLDRSVSELLQHEIDHFYGVLSLDIATAAPVSRELFEQNKAFYLRQIGSDYSISMTHN